MTVQPGKQTGQALCFCASDLGAVPDSTHKDQPLS